MSALFISDLHLSETTPRLNQAFFRFLDEQAAQAKQLFILGDLFETWLGDDDPSMFAKQITYHLCQLTDRGVQLYIMRGNRDFMIGDHFAHATGAILLGDPTCLEIANNEVVLLHGDTLCSDDIRYQKYRKQIQHPITQFILRHSPLFFRRKLAQGLRGKSSQENEYKPTEIMDVTEQTVLDVFARHEVSIMIHGHTHRPKVHEHGNKRRFVLGDWGEQLWYLRVDDSGFELVPESI